MKKKDVINRRDIWEWLIKIENFVCLHVSWLRYVVG